VYSARHENLRTLKVEVGEDQVVNPQKFEKWISNGVFGIPGRAHLVRGKAVLSVGGSDQKYVFLARGNKIESNHTASFGSQLERSKVEWQKSETRVSKVVLVGFDLNVGFLERSFSECLESPREHLTRRQEKDVVSLFPSKPEIPDAKFRARASIVNTVPRSTDWMASARSKLSFLKKTPALMQLSQERAVFRKSLVLDAPVKSFSDGIGNFPKASTEGVVGEWSPVTFYGDALWEAGGSDHVQMGCQSLETSEGASYEASDFLEAGFFTMELGEAPAYETSGTSALLWENSWEDFEHPHFQNGRFQ
jgi:hypothetical protein